MKRIALSAAALLILLLSWGGLCAADDIKEFPSCQYCGMNRDMFSQTRMMIQYDDHTQAGFCSLHCAAIDMALTIDKGMAALWVGDYQSKQLIDAATAHWVVGADVPGVMTRRSKVAFGDKEAALKFQLEKKGSIVDFETAVKAAYEDMYADTQMIREKRKMKKMKHQEHHK